ncbi:MAG: ATP synthase F1 subunit delta [Bacteroidetes bacterium]|nr:ATP synthase F1 subunit delta [Bacteroidota bacterium]
MRQYKVAHRYAKALFQLALEGGSLEAVHSDMQLIGGLGHAEFSRMMVSPIIKSDAKAKAFATVFGNRISPLTASFFNLVFRKGRSLSLSEIQASFEAMYLDYKGVVVAELTTALPASDAVKEDMRRRLEALPQMAGKKVILHDRVDPSIIGGYVLQLGDHSLDASIRRDLRTIQTQFVENMYVQNIR